MDFVKVYRCDKFDDYSEKLKLAIEMTKDEYECKYAYMTHSDYKVDYRNKKPLYEDMLLELVGPHIQDYADSWYCSDWRMKNMWFAEYYDGGRFGWHTHEGVNMSAVLQLELDDTSNATELFGLNMKLQEGDLVIFPAMMPHRSPIVNNGNKLIIAFNFNMYGSTLNNEV